MEMHIHGEIAKNQTKNLISIIIYKFGNERAQSRCDIKKNAKEQFYIHYNLYQILLLLFFAISTCMWLSI